MNIAVSGFDQQFEKLLNSLNRSFIVHEEPTTAKLEKYLLNQSLFTLPDLVLVYVNDLKAFEAIRSIKKQPLLKGLIVVLVAPDNDPNMFSQAKELQVSDLFVLPLHEEQLVERLQFLVKFQLMKPTVEQLSRSVPEVQFRMPIIKRLFDILFAGTLILLLSPLLLIVAIIIRLESKGPIVYKSKRTGTGYLVFDFYKFRSMHVDADKKLAQMSELNQYQAEEAGSGAKKAAFMKIKNDPRITKVGSFIRNTSIDEIPQLFNILKGDMSVVGNRPLPLYEAEQLTSNDWAMRFAAPAGLTGLWQIKKRGTSDMSERERKKLDNFYAENYSFWFDMKILFGTVPALLQKEKV